MLTLASPQLELTGSDQLSSLVCETRNVAAAAPPFESNSSTMARGPEFVDAQEAGLGW